MMKNEETAKRLSEALSRARMKPQELADRSGVSKSSISQYINGSHAPSNLSAGKMGRVLGVSPVWLMGFDVSAEMPVWGRVAAGEPSEMIEDIIYPEDDYKRNLGEYFTLEIHGDSMSPGICDGDTVIVHKQEEAESGDVVIATINGDAATCKRLKIREDGIELKPDNEVYAPFVFSREDVERMPVRISGKVVELRRKI